MPDITDSNGQLEPTRPNANIRVVAMIAVIVTAATIAIIVGLIV